MKRSTRERLRYNAVRNYTGDARLARQARGWSEQRIFETYGIKLPKRPPKLRTYTQRTYKRHWREIAKFQRALLLGYNAEQAAKLKRRRFDQIKPPDVADPDLPSITPETPEQRKRRRRDRRKRWIDWVSSKSMPVEYEELAREINERNGFDGGANYGWAVVYYMFTENISMEEAERRLKPDRQSDGEFYKIVGRVFD